MRRRLSMLGLVTLACLVTACGPRKIRGSGIMAGEDRTVRGISAVRLLTYGELQVQQGEAEALRVEAEDNLLPFLVTNVHDGTLEIGAAPEVTLRPRRWARYRLTVIDLEAIEIWGPDAVTLGDLTLDELEIRHAGDGNLSVDALQVRRLALWLTGGGSMSIQRLEGEVLEANLASRGDLRIEGGAVTAQDLTLTGPGDASTWQMSSREAWVRVRDGGSAWVHAAERLEVRLSGRGDVHYAGDPTISLVRTGVGRVRPLGE